MFLFDQVLHLRMRDGSLQSVTEVYSEAGDTSLSVASVAVHYKGAILVGSVDHNMLYCQLML